MIRRETIVKLFLNTSQFMNSYCFCFIPCFTFVLEYFSTNSSFIVLQYFIRHVFSFTPLRFFQFSFRSNASGKLNRDMKGSNMTRKRLRSLAAEKEGGNTIFENFIQNPICRSKSFRFINFSNIILRTYIQ